MRKRTGRGLDPETALKISIDGNARRLVHENTPTLEAVTELRNLAGERRDLLAETAGAMIGGYLGHSLSSPTNLAAAHLLVLAANGHHHDVLVKAADEARRNSSTSAYTN